MSRRRSVTLRTCYVPNAPVYSFDVSVRLVQAINFHQDVPHDHLCTRKKVYHLWHTFVNGNKCLMVNKRTNSVCDSRKRLFKPLAVFFLDIWWFCSWIETGCSQNNRRSHNFTLKQKKSTFINNSMYRKILVQRQSGIGIDFKKFPCKNVLSQTVTCKNKTHTH